MSSDDKAEKDADRLKYQNYGRPEIPINLERFKSLCALQCTLMDIAGQFECSDDKIQMWCKQKFGKTFSEVRAIYASNGIVSVRAQLFKRMQESDMILKHLSENLLGYNARTNDRDVLDIKPITLKYNLEETDDEKEKSNAEDADFTEADQVPSSEKGNDKK